MAKLSAVDSVVIDVGANVGQSSSVMARSVGPRGMVIALEPLPDAFELLQKGTRGMQVVPLPLAAGEDFRTVDLHVPLNSRGIAQPQLASVNQIVGESISVAVRMIPLDSLRQILPAQLSLIKIDVEGHELAVLKGATGLLEEFRPALVIEIEVRHQAEGRQIDDVFDYLGALGYRIQALSSRGRIPLEEFDLERDQLHPLSSGTMDLYINNFVALPG